MEYVLKFLNVIIIICEVLVIFNLLILVHEIGHFLAAKWRGLVIEELGIWFGKPLWKKKINGVNYSFGSIPFGGFVKLPQMSPMETIEGESETKRENLPQISPLDKIIVAFAGPLFSFGLACVFATIVFLVGRPVGQAESTTTIGYVEPDDPAQKAGFQIGDKILEVDGHKVNRFGGMADDSITWCIVRSEGKIIPVEVWRIVDGKPAEITLKPEPRPPEKSNWWSRPSLREIGVSPECASIVSDVEPGSTADKAGLKKGDMITAIDGQPLYSPFGFYDYMKDHPQTTYQLTVQRDGKTLPPLTFDPGGVKVKAIPNYPNSPAKASDLKVGDIITEMNGKPVQGAIAFMEYIRNHGVTPINLTVTRDGKQLDHPIVVTPSIPERAPDDEYKPMLGIHPDNNDGLEFDGRGIEGTDWPSPVEQIRASLTMILDTINAVFSPKSSIGLQQVGGPVMMMHAYYSMLDRHDGWKLALWFSVILNVNLALINLLPIPVLDGGHIMLAVIEAVRRRPLNLKILEIIQGTCAVVIIGFMLFIVFYDVQDLPFVPHPPPTIIFSPSSGSSR